MTQILKPYVAADFNQMHVTYSSFLLHMGLDARKPVFEVYVKVRPISQTSLLSYRDSLEYLNFARLKWSHINFHGANNKGTGQTVRMPRLVCTFVVVI